MNAVQDSFLAQLDALLEFYEQHKKPDSRGDYSLSAPDSVRFTTAALAAADRIAGSDSAYAETIRKTLETYKTYDSYVLAGVALEVVQALRSDVEGGFLASARELIHAEVFADFLEVADYLLSENYKDAAAVMGGGVLESHLRRLSARFGIDVEVISSSGVVKPKRAEQMNSDLAGVKAYTVLDQKSVTAWLDLRNKAAHAKYGEYSAEQVALFLDALRDFITRHPA